MRDPAAAGALARRELDADGVPIRLAIPEWHRCLEILGAGRRQAGDWPPGSEEAIGGFMLATLRFARPDGSPSMHAVGSRAGFRGLGTRRLGHLVSGDGDRPGLGMVVHARPDRRRRAPPLPAWSAPGRVLAMLRPDWLPDGDFLAVDHRDAGSPCRFELTGAGRTLARPGMERGLHAARADRRRGPGRSRWVTGSTADLVEWSYRGDGLRITRSALLAPRPTPGAVLGPGRGARGEWKADADDAPGDAAGRRGRTAQAIPSAGTGRVETARCRRRSCRSPCRASPIRPIAGRSGPWDDELILRQAPAGRRCWLPLLVSWDPARHRKALSWRVLTVSERSRAVGPDRAFAARVSWGRDETYVVYRSLGPPAPRAFLGYQTAARFLIGEFDHRWRPQADPHRGMTSRPDSRFQIQN